MKVDLIVAYYQQAKFLPYLFHGVEGNKEEIRNIIFSMDEESPEEKEAILKVFPQATVLSHPHTTFGICKSYNQALENASSEYAVITAADCYLPAGFIAKKLNAANKEKVLISGPVHHIYLPPTSEDPILEPDFIRKDRYESYLGGEAANRSPWSIFRGANRLVHTDSAIAVRFDEEFDEFNFEDKDFTIRWLSKYGSSSLVYEDTPVWHLEDPKGIDSSPKIYPLKSAIKLSHALLKYFSYRVNLYSIDHQEVEAMNVGMPDTVFMGADVILPCEVPDWLPEGKVQELINYSLHRVNFVEQHLKTIKKAMAPGGILKLGPINTELFPLIEKYKFVIEGFDPIHHTIEAING